MASHDTAPQPTFEELSREQLEIYAREFQEHVHEERRLRRELEHALGRVGRAMEQTIHAVAFICETRDPYTAGHQRRVSQLAGAITREMGLPEEQVEAITIAGLLHDLGKIAVPVEILAKPGKLSQHEFAIIKTHPQVSYEVLKGIDLAPPVAQAALQHHERLDGSGYPSGLVGDQIIPEARILAVTDVVEAITHHRPYRPALGIDKALFEILQERGVLFDATAVDACLKLFNEKGFTFDEA